MSSEDINQVTLAGRVSSIVPERTLPSGDQVATVRVVVARQPHQRRGSKQTFDAIECEAWTVALRRQVDRLHVGDRVKVTGRLRGQFSRNAAGIASRVTIDTSAIGKEPSLVSDA